jgi:hypothetical protein
MITNPIAHVKLNECNNIGSNTDKSPPTLLVKTPKFQNSSLLKLISNLPCRKIDQHIDAIRCYFESELVERLFAHIETNGFKRASDSWQSTKNGKKRTHERCRKYTLVHNENIEVQIDYTPSASKKRALLTLHNPSDITFEIMFSFEKPLKINEIELALDFYGNAKALERHIARFIFLKHRRLLSFRWKGTSYSQMKYTKQSNGRARKTAKTEYGYIKANDLYRRELVIRRRILKDNGIDRLPDLFKLASLDLSRCVSFKTLNYGTLIKWMYKHYCNEMRNKQSAKKIRCNRKQKSKSLLKFSLEKFVYDHVAQLNLSEQVDWLKNCDWINRTRKGNYHSLVVDC